MKVYPIPAETTASTDRSIIEVMDLWRSYRNFWGRESHALRGIDFSVRAGDVTGLLGPNGAGKTTTLKTILGMLKPTRGTVRLFGAEITDRAARARLGFLTEQPYFYDYLTAPEFLDLCGVLCGVDRPTRIRRTRELLEQVGLASSGSLRLRKYSKGMLQRLGLAQALIHDPALVILDEPMSGLDPLGRSLVRDVILSLKKKGTTVLFSTHILPDVEALCDQVIVLAGGRVAAAGTVLEMGAEADPGFEVVVQHLAAAQKTALAERGLAVRDVAGCTIVHTPDRPTMNRIVAEILGSGAQLASVSPKRSPLEARFLAAVAESSAAGAASRVTSMPMSKTGTHS